ncbi:hypothetical protein [Clostridium beijerinckii]|uniref:hypothetical protein n=1 Tax=Clostridium beijerinckii TaxID=1520 RepID=UPI00157011BB|nr:hypothetical protein [Clostridium beijerinckii]NRU52602.1 hypothetical protein [Clostridium beijerinckii]NYC68645.1 hypothetical protein [Clostridium beijerinckii]
MNNKLKIQNTSEIILQQIRARDHKISELEKEVLVMNEELNKKKYTIKVLVGILSILLIGNLIMIIK